uniref:Developmentally regulated GTP binding protein 2 n=1 Tax=Equus asinus TaxID=9793 RepID=A0A9L0JDS8_EQUAS
MGILEKISEIEKEIARTQKNKATEYHLGLLKAKLAKYRAQLLEPSKSASSKGEGFDVMKSGDARVALIGFPSVGKLWHEAEPRLLAGDALGVLGPDLHLHQEERTEARLHGRHHPPERGLRGACVPPHPPVAGQPVQVRPGVGYQHQVQPTAGGPDPHHGARGCHPDRQEVVAPARPPPPPPHLPGESDPVGHTKAQTGKIQIQLRRGLLSLCCFQKFPQ